MIRTTQACYRLPCKIIILIFRSPNITSHFSLVLPLCLWSRFRFRFRFSFRIRIPLEAHRLRRPPPGRALKKGHLERHRRTTEKTASARLWGSAHSHSAGGRCDLSSFSSLGMTTAMSHHPQQPLIAPQRNRLPLAAARQPPCACLLVCAWQRG